MEEDRVLPSVLPSPSKEAGDSDWTSPSLSRTSRTWASSPRSGPHSRSGNSTHPVSPNEQDNNRWVGGSIIYGKGPRPVPTRCYFWFPSSMIKVGEKAAVGRLGEVWVGWVSVGQVPLGKFPWGWERVAVVSWEINQEWLQDQWVDYDVPREKSGSKEWLEAGGEVRYCVWKEVLHLGPLCLQMVLCLTSLAHKNGIRINKMKWKIHIFKNWKALMK